MIGLRRRRGEAAVAGGVFLILAALAGGAAQAQMQLPGAHNGGVAGVPSTPAAGTRSDGSAKASAAPPLSAKPVVIRPPSEDAIAGKVLSLDGTRGSMSFDKSGSGLALSKVTFAGEKISSPGTACQVAVALGSPVAAVPSGRPAGAFRYSVPLPVCPFSFDVLDGAVLVSRPEPVCDYLAADCRVSPAGLWGPPAADINAKRSKDLERERVRLETTMRADFRALLKRAKKDKASIKAIAKEQAAFSSEREMTCRDYQAESVHGFCSTQITQARVLALLAQFGSDLDEGGDGKAARRSRSRRPAAVEGEP